MTKISTTSKPSTASDTDTRKTEARKRWLRLDGIKPDLPELDQLLDAYWGGPERRITGLTVRIIAVNAVALVMLVIGLLYLSQYQLNLVEAKLDNFKTRVDLISTAISESAVSNGNGFSEVQAMQMAEKLSTAMEQRILLFNKDGTLIMESDWRGQGSVESKKDFDTFYSVEILKNMARLVLKFLPERQKLLFYPKIESTSAINYPDALQAFAGETSFSAWTDENEHILLSAAAPLINKGEVVGIVLLTRTAQDIEHDIGVVWLNILKISAFTLAVTVMLSIYLSGVIAKPLRRLARAAEGVRKGKLSYDHIPDMSDRHDEIGELSIALRQMTAALGERMDSIERFAADVSHELKNPLTSLRSAIETASIVKKKTDREKLMAIIMHDIERLDRLISDISNASRLDAELSREALQKINLQRSLNNLLEAYKGPLTRGALHQDRHSDAVIDGINVRLSFPGREDLHVWGLKGHLEQVFQNLLFNALSFSPEDGEILIKAIKQKNQAVITFEDQGPGIPPNRLETIFERFYSERPDHEGYGQHSGLGLSICKQIIGALGGEIFAENAKNKAGDITGARFTVILNVA